MRPTSSRSRSGPLLFLPARWQRVALLKWLKKVHAWTGLWGAVLFLGLGVSGFLLNHRQLLRIDTNAAREVSKLDVAVSPGRLRDNSSLDAWARAALNLPGEGYTPPEEPEADVSILGRSLPQARRLTRVFPLVDGSVTVSTVPGSGVVSVAHDRVGLLAVLQNMHKGTGLGVAWILLIDTMAGALIAMSVTGVLLWSRLHGPRVAAICLAAGSLAWAAAAGTGPLVDASGSTDAEYRSNRMQRP